MQKIPKGWGQRQFLIGLELAIALQKKKRNHKVPQSQILSVNDTSKMKCPPMKTEILSQTEETFVMWLIAF